MGKVKIGIIGCGGIANGKHMPSLSKVSEAEMVAFCDIISERAEKAAKEYGVEGAKVFEDYHDLLACKEIDVVHEMCIRDRRRADRGISDDERIWAGRHGALRPLFGGLCAQAQSGAGHGGLAHIAALFLL